MDNGKASAELSVVGGRVRVMSSTVTPAPPTSPVAVLHQTRERLAGLLETL